MSKPGSHHSDHFRSMVLLPTLIMLVLSCDRPRMSAVADKKDVAEQERLLAELSALGYAGFVVEEMNEKESES